MNAKIILSVGSVLLVIFLVILFMFLGVLSGKKNSLVPVSLSKPTTVPTSQIGKGGVNPTISPETPILKTFSSSYFSFSYPSQFNLTDGIPTSEGYTMFLKSSDNYKPSVTIVISANPLNKVDIEKIKDQQIVFGLTGSHSVIGVSKDFATTYKGVLSFPYGKVQKSVVIFEKNSFVYKLDLSYPSDSESLEINSFFDEILSSFKPLK